MKKIYILCLLAIISSASFAQAVVIAENPGYSGSSVVGQLNYHVSESIYTNEEIGPGNYITAGSAIQQVYFLLLQEGSSPAISNFRIYMKNVPAATTTLATGAYSTAGYTPVFNGVFNATPVGYVSINLTAPFVRTAGSNLQVLIERVDNVLHTNIIFQTSGGNNFDAAASSSRRYNSATAPVSGTTSLTATTLYRPAIAFNHTFPIDAITSDLFFPNGVSCYTVPQPVSVEILNGGTTDIAPGAAAVTLHIRGANTYTATLTNTNTIPANEFDTITFTGVNLNNLGTNFDTAYVTLAGDGTTFNDTLTTASGASPTITSLPGTPVIEDAEELSPLPQDVFTYARGIIGPQLWEIEPGPYTNPDQTDPLPAATGTQFYSFDSYYNGLPGYTSRLYSKCITLPAANSGPAGSTTGAMLTFQMSHDSIFSHAPDILLDSMYVSVSADHGITWTRLAGYQRPEATAPLPFWRMQSVNLDAYAGQTIQIGFEGVSKFGNAFGLDDIHVDTTFIAPVSLLDFTAQRNGAVNMLNWKTSQELNSNKFIIERSTDGGRNFSQIGQVAAAGYSSTERSYRFTDPSPVKGINYYRLRVIDLDNSYKFSAIKNVRNLGFADLSFAPNPVQQQMKINLDAEKADKGAVTITDMSGRQVYSNTINVISGSNIIFVETGKLAPGSYIIKVQLSDDRVVKKFDKL